MKRWCQFAAGLLALVASAATGYFAVSPGPLPPGLYPDRTEIDFGRVAQGETLSATVPHTNRYDRTVAVVDLSRECSCSDSRVDRMSVDPGQELNLHVDWKVGTRRGRIEETVGVLGRVGDKLVEVRHVRLRAVVVPDFEYEPRRIAFERGRAETVTVRFRPVRAASVAVIAATSNQNGVTATPVPDEGAIQVRYDPSVPDAGELGIRFVVTTDSRNEPRVEVPIDLRSAVGGRTPPAAMPGRGGSEVP